jgi:uncharacterized membrane protein (DUF106 family)
MINPNVKNHAISTLLFLLSLIIFLIIIIPKQKEIDKEKNIRYRQIAKYYDEKTNSYKDVTQVTKLQEQVDDIDNDSIWLKWFKWLISCIILTTGAAIFSTWLQALFTGNKFTKDWFDSPDEKRSSSNVLAASLIGGTLISCLVYYMSFSI